jgi:uncharacterized membrane protein YgcG
MNLEEMSSLDYDLSLLAAIFQLIKTLGATGFVAAAAGSLDGALSSAGTAPGSSSGSSGGGSSGGGGGGGGRW